MARSNKLVVSNCTLISVSVGGKIGFDIIESVGKLNRSALKPPEHCIKPEITDPVTKESMLSARDLQVLHLMAEGLTTKTVAGLLQVTSKIAACHRWNILKKLRVDSTVSGVQMGRAERVDRA
jgi:DNA-binding NarL/FixJ family response regulator